MTMMMTTVTSRCYDNTNNAAAFDKQTPLCNVFHTLRRLFLPCFVARVVCYFHQFYLQSLPAKPPSPVITSAKDYVIIVGYVSLSVSNFAQKLPNGFA